MVTLAVAAVLLVAGLVVEWTIHSEPVALALFWGAILIGGVYPLRSAIRAVRHKRLTITVLLVVAANVLRIVERELLDDTDKPVRASLAGLGFDDETELAEAIRDGRLDERGDEVMACLQLLVRHRLSFDHPGYADGL